MTESDRRAPGYIVFRQVSEGVWHVIGEVDRRPGLPARIGRARAVEDATGSAPKPGEAYAVLQRSEWRLAHDF